MGQVTDPAILAQLNGGNAPGGPIYGAPPAPKAPPAPPSPFQVEDQDWQREDRDRKRREWEAAHNPDGTPKPVGGSDSLDPKTLAGQKNISRGILVNSGVDLETGADPVAELIKSSTSGKLQSLGADAYGAVTGDATSGMENIGRLRAIGNDMVLQMTGGSLGTQISNADREFIAARMGDIANPDKPWNERLAAWGEVKRRMAKISGINLPPEPDQDGQDNPLAPPAAGVPPAGGNHPPADGQPFTIKPVPGQEGPPPVGDMGDQQQVASGATKDAPHSITDKQVLATINQMWLQGKSIDEINGYVTARGYEAVSEPDAITDKYYRKRGGPFKLGKKRVPTSQRERDAASPVGAYFGNSTHAVPFSDEIYGAASALTGGDYTEARDRFEGNRNAMFEMHPKASIAGMATGALLTGPATRIAGLQVFPNATRATGAAMAANPIKTSTGMGVLYGTGADNQNRLRGGAVGGAFGGVLGATIQKVGVPAGNALADRVAQRRAGAVIPNAPEVAAAGQAEGVTVNRAMIDPRLENRVTGVDASLAGGPKLRRGMNEIEGQIEGRVNALGRDGNVMDTAAAGQTYQAAGERFIKESGKAAGAKYTRAERLAGDAKVTPEQSLQAVDDAIVRLSETPGTNSAEIAFLNTLKSDLSKDLSVGGLRRMRTSLRKKISNGGLVFGEDEARVLGVMDAAATDIRLGLQAQGKSKAAKAFDIADKEYRGRMEFINGSLQKIIGKRGSNLSSEQVANNLSGMARGRDTEGVKAFLAKLNPDEHADVAATFAESLGRNNRGEFSVAHFLTQTSERKFPNRALATIFGNDGAQSIQNLRVLGKEVDRVNRMRNTSNTARAADYRSVLINTLLGLGSGVGTGSITTGLATTATAGGLKAGRDMLSARMLLNPKITRWVQTAPRTTNPAAINAHIGRLESMSRAGTIGRMDAQAIQDYLRAAVGQSPGRAAAEDEGN